MTDNPRTTSPAVPSIATVISMTPSQAERLADGKQATAFIWRQRVDAVDFYAKQPRLGCANGG